MNRIRKADYDGDRAALRSLYDRLADSIDDKDTGARMSYWRGFSMWRSAINGFNDNTDPAELEADLHRAIREFERAAQMDPAFMDAKIAMVSCYGYLGYIHRDDAEYRQQFRDRITPVVQEVKAKAADNPRLIWIMGPVLWNTPVEKGGGQANAIASYKKGLELIRSQEPPEDPLAPAWGEPELLMNLAWSYLNQAQPDIAAAEGNARAALAIVPCWHYVKDILMPQIQEAKQKAASQKSSTWNPYDCTGIPLQNH